LTEPVITINGRVLIEPQVVAVRAAINYAREGAIDRDRLDEVLQMIVSAPVGSRPQGPGSIPPLAELSRQRVNRILQLAGIVPEQASRVERDLASGYASAGVMVDEAAVRLQRALEKP
jgi:hypothetical protein